MPAGIAPAGQPGGTRRYGRENYPVQKKFLLDPPRHHWLVRAAHTSGPGVGYVALLRAAIDLLDAEDAQLAALRDNIAAHPVTGRDRGKTITLNITADQEHWLRVTSHRTGDLGVTQHQLIHGLIDWLADTPAVLDTIRATLPGPE
jgi:hypothetical protein